MLRYLARTRATVEMSSFTQGIEEAASPQSSPIPPAPEPTLNVLAKNDGFKIGFLSRKSEGSANASILPLPRRVATLSSLDNEQSSLREVSQKRKRTCSPMPDSFRLPPLRDWPRSVSTWRSSDLSAPGHFSLLPVSHRYRPRASAALDAEISEGNIIVSWAADTTTQQVDIQGLRKDMQRVVASGITAPAAPVAADTSRLASLLIPEELAKGESSPSLPRASLAPDTRTLRLLIEVGDIASFPLVSTIGDDSN